MQYSIFILFLIHVHFKPTKAERLVRETRQAHMYKVCSNIKSRFLKSNKQTK